MATHEVVILGGSYGGFVTAHELVKKYIPLITKATGQKFHLTMISLSSHFHFPVAVPRAVVEPSLVPPAKLETSIKDNINLAQDVFVFVHAEVTSLDTASRTVHYTILDDQYNKGAGSSIHYDSLFIALGSRTKHPAFKLRGSHLEAVQEMEKLNNEIQAAESIVLAGGGPVAVETAGELGSKYGKSKSITVLTNGPRLLHNVNPDIGTTAKSYLEHMGVHVGLSSKVTAATKLENGQTRVAFGDGQSVDVDLYIDTTGVIPNNEPLPRDLLTDRGFLEVDAYQRATKAGPLVYGLGDIVGGWAQIAELVFIKGVLFGNWAYEVSGGKVGKETAWATPKNSMMLVPVGRKKAVATAFGWRFPSWLGWLLKGRDFMIGKAGATVSIDVEARSIGNVDGSLSNTHINLFKRMETIASGQNHNTRFVTPAYFSDLIEANSGSLGLYLKYSKEARDRVGELDEEDPYVSRLRQIAREYSWSVEENIQLDIIPWQKFINAQLLANLQRPWSEQWEMPIDGLTAIERIEGLSEAAFLKYPTAEITNEDEFDQSGPLLDEQVSTYDYIREFTVPFDSIYELADWIFTPTYAPASIATATDEGSLSINLLRRRRIKASLETIYYKLRGIISRLQDPGTKVLGEIKTPWLEAAYADELDILPPGFSCRSTIHEYGGAAFKPYPDQEAVVCTVTGDNAGIYKVNVETKPDGAVAAAPPALLMAVEKPDRFANFAVNPKDSSVIIAVMEHHGGEDAGSVVNSLVLIAGDPGNTQCRTIANGADFYSSPSWSPDGSKVTWLQWNHPDMPWTGGQVFVADWKDGKLENKRSVAGKACTESASQPRWSPDGSLFYCSDKTGYWQLYKHDESGDSSLVSPKGLQEVDFSEAEWALGWHTYDFLSPTRLVASYIVNATSRTILIDLSDNSYKQLDHPFVETLAASIHAVSDCSFTIIASTADRPSALYLCSVSGDDRASYNAIARSTPVQIPKDLISTARHITFSRTSSPEPSTVAHAWYYAPTNPAYKAPEGSSPPLVISLHGGPTAYSACGLSLPIQYWTSRGYAYAYVNYTGSTGYGRKFRDGLNTKWGVADVSDAVDCVHFLADQGLVDKTRVGIVGGSAGGYGVLQAICSYADVWAACVSNYGISSLKALIEHTHKFESKYMDGLLWNSDASEDERERILAERSPLLRAASIKAPVLLLQGVEDKVVPKEQAEEMARVIESNGGVVRVELFEGEGHGWRKETTVIKATKLQEEWWRKYLVRE
ncbi:Seprase [Drechslerella dactyloides]|uniref:Seprase n=1 Tax=Drechslerella dactyloides TaxID=74499 RepID=A0AAD6NMT6_DREDA|nr:Seprase [Drechslerella dactyloides]